MKQIDNYEWLFLIPKGWVELAQKMIEECEAINSSYQIEDMKEKWGELRVSSYICDYEDSDWMIPSCNDEEIEAIENKYIEQSRKTCCIYLFSIASISSSLQEIEAIENKYIEQVLRLCSIYLFSIASISCNDEEIEAIENKYIEQSRKTCCICGKPATKMSIGWICPYCDNCGDKNEKFYKRFK